MNEGRREVRTLIGLSALGDLIYFDQKIPSIFLKTVAQVKNEDLTYQHILLNISFPGVHLFCSVDKPLACFNIGKTISQREHTKLDNDAHHKPQEKKAQDLKKGQDKERSGL